MVFAKKMTDAMLATTWDTCKFPYKITPLINSPRFHISCTIAIAGSSSNDFGILCYP